jgi:hypothetical protein
MSALGTSCGGLGAPAPASPAAGDSSAPPPTSERSLEAPSAAVTPREVSDSCRDDAGALPTEATSAAQPTSDLTIAGLLTSDPRFELFCGIASQAVSPGLGLSWLEIWDWPASRMGDNQDGVTVFAPTDDAFATLDSVVLAALENGALANEVLISLLAHHYIHWLYASADFQPGAQPTRGRSTTVELSLAPLTFGGCAVVETDIRVANGVVHVLDCVVVPVELAEAVAP